jgi:glycosyltransferase involved in cell wall biosynthesis
MATRFFNMRLLIITQTVDQHDTVLGFFHRWLVEFAKLCDEVTVIALGVGEYDLPPNVTVVSLGKEKGQSRLKYVLNLNYYLRQHGKEVDAVLIHMNPIYLVLFGWWFKWKKIVVGLWYTHRQVDLKLRLAVPFCDHVFTAAPESFNLETEKLHVVGHGIETGKFVCAFRADPQKEVIITHIGRLTPIKNCDTLIDAAAILKTRLRQPFKVRFIGAPAVASDVLYAEQLHHQVDRLLLSNIVEFVGNIKNTELPQHICGSTITVNLTPTGGIDKSVLESMSSGRPVLVSNTAFAPVFGQYAPDLVFEYRNAADLSAKIEKLITGGKYEAIATSLHETAVKYYDVSMIVKTIVDYLNLKS